MSHPVAVSVPAFLNTHAIGRGLRMHTEHFIIAAVENRWRVTADNGFEGSFLKRSDAIRAAIVAAEEAGRSGEQAQVLALDETGKLYPVWRYGHDAIWAEHT